MIRISSQGTSLSRSRSSIQDQRKTKPQMLNCQSIKKFVEDITSNETPNRPFIEQMQKYENSLLGLPLEEIEKLVWSIPTQLEIKPKNEQELSMLVEITNKSTANKSGKGAEGTIFDNRLGTLSGTECGTCPHRDCLGHDIGRIFFPKEGMIPYEHLIDFTINILSCMCLNCDKLILNNEALDDLQLDRYKSRKARISTILEATKKMSCLQIVKGSKCGSKFTYNKEATKDTGFFVYTDERKLKNQLSGFDVDRHFRNLAQDPNALKYLGFSDVEDLCSLICVGVIVPGVPDRPFIETHEKMKNPINEDLVKIIVANENLKDEIAIRRKTKVFSSQIEDDTGILAPSELKRKKTEVITQSERIMSKTSSDISSVEKELLATIDALNNSSFNREINSTIKELELETRKLITQINEARSRQDTSRAEILEGMLSNTRSKIDENQRKIDQHPINIEVKKKISALREEIDNIKSKGSEKLEEISRQFNQIKRKEDAYFGLSEIDQNERDFASLITALYRAHKEYVKHINEKTKGKHGDLRRRGIGKHSHLVGRGVASPGTDIDIDEIEIPWYLAPALGVTEEVTSDNLIRIEMLLDIKNRKITHIRRGTKSYDVTDAAIISGMIKVREGDIVTRHLQDGDIVVAVRMPSIHRGNMLAFRAKIVRGSYTIRVHMIWTTSYNLDFDGDEISLYVPQGEAIEEAIRTMYAPLNLISPRSALPIGGAVYNAISAWYLITKDDKNISWEFFFDVITKIESRYSVEKRDRAKNKTRRFLSRHKARGKTTITGKDLFSFLLPEDFNYPKLGEEPVEGVIIESGFLIEGILTDEHLAPGKPKSIIYSLYHSLSNEEIIIFFNSLYYIAYAYQNEHIQTITAQDCAYGEQIIARVRNDEEFNQVRNKLDILIKEVKTVNEYEKIIIEQFKLGKEVARVYAEDYLIQKRIENLLYVNMTLLEQDMETGEKIPVYTERRKVYNYMSMIGGRDYAILKYQEVISKFIHDEEVAEKLASRMTNISESKSFVKEGYYMKAYDPRTLIYHYYDYSKYREEIDSLLYENIYTARTLATQIDKKNVATREEILVKISNKIIQARTEFRRNRVELILRIKSILESAGLKGDEAFILETIRSRKSDLMDLINGLMEPVGITQLQAQWILIDKIISDFNLTVEGYSSIVEDLIQNVEPISTITGGNEALRKEYEKIIKEVKGVTDKESREMARTIIIGKASEIEGSEKLKIAEMKIRMMPPPPTNPIGRKAYENKIVEIISEIGNVGAEAASEVRKFVNNNLLDMASKIGAGAKGNLGNISMMGGYIGQQQIKGQARLLPDMTGSTRCLSALRPGDMSLQAQGYITDNYFSGMSPINTFLGAVGQREGMADTATKTASAGLFANLACKAMENLIVMEGKVVSQTGQLYQYHYGQDGFAAENLIVIKGIPTFADMNEICDSVNYKYGWMLSTEAEK